MVLRRAAMARAHLAALDGCADPFLVARGGSFALVLARGLAWAPGERWHKVALFESAMRSTFGGRLVSSGPERWRCGLCGGRWPGRSFEHLLRMDGNPYGFTTS